MLEVPFSIGSKPAANNKNQLVSFSIPFSKSAVYSVDQLVVVDDEINAELNADFLAISYWPDSSIKWLRCEFITLANKEPSLNYKIIVNTQNSTPAQKQTFNITEQAEQFTVNCQQHNFLVNKSQLGFNCLPWHVELFDKNGQQLKQIITQIKVIDKNYDNYSELKREGTVGYDSTFKIFSSPFYNISNGKK